MRSLWIVGLKKGLKKMKSKSSKDFFSRVGLLLLLDIAVWVVVLVGSFTVRSFLIEVFPKNADTINVVLCAVYLVIYYAAIAFTMIANPITRASWLNYTAGKKYSFKEDMREFLKYDFVDEMVCYLLVCLPVHLMIQYLGDLGLSLSQFFIGQSAIFAILECNVWLSYLLNMVLYALFWLVTVAIAHFVWNKQRLRK